MKHLVLKVVDWILCNFVLRSALQHLQRQSLIVYLKGLDAVRRSLVVAVLVIAMIQLMAVGLAGVLVIGTWWLVEDMDTRLAILIAAFSLLFAVPLALFSYLLSSRNWYRLSQAQPTVERFTADS